MRALFDTADQLHKTVSECVLQGIRTMRVANAAFRQFTTALNAFERRLRECEIADDWGPFLGFLKLSRLRYATTPLKASSLVRSTRVRSKSPIISRLIDTSDSTTKELYKELDRAFQLLQQDAANPLWTQFIELHSSSGEKARQPDCPTFEPTPSPVIGILCFWNDLAGEIEALLSSEKQRLRGRLSVVRPPQLKEVELFDEIVVFGSLRWLEKRGWSFVYDAPRGRIVRAFCFSDIPDYQPVFYQLEGSPHTFPGAAGSSPRTAHAGFTSIVIGGNAGEAQVPMHGTPNASPEVLDQMFPSIDLDRVSRGSATVLSFDDTDRVEAVFMELSGSTGVWLDPESKVYRLDLSGVGREIQCLSVTHPDVREVSPGDVLLFSTAGGGDMIAEEANRLMGDRAVLARQQQARWKRELELLVRMQGLDRVCKTLKAAGVTLATTHNVRNWINRGSIAPREPKHFSALLTECGLHKEAAAIESATNLIRKAHRVAGKLLSKKLLQMIKGRSLAALADSGRQVFGGNEAIASEKTAYVVESISQETRTVDTLELAKPFRLEDDLWR